ncbi:MAG: Fic family protein [Deltaproteobacteria bacterium]|nr:Fic family protein [Deltaproteobacteria bacterium]
MQEAAQQSDDKVRGDSSVLSAGTRGKRDGKTFSDARTHTEGKVPPDKEAAWLHRRFVRIRPFQDVNGRAPEHRLRISASRRDFSRPWPRRLAKANTLIPWTWPIRAAWDNS